MPLSSSIKFSLAAKQTGSQDFGGPLFTPDISMAMSLVDGVVAGAADLCFFDERTVLSAANDDIDLAGVLANTFGGTISFAKLVALLLVNKPKSGPANTTNLTLGGGTNPFIGFLGGTAPTIGPIRPGGFLMLGCDALAGIGSPVAGTGDILRIANSSGAAATYQIGLLGRSS